jgi:hypothetical protein
MVPDHGMAPTIKTVDAKRFLDITRVITRGRYGKVIVRCVAQSELTTS